MQLFRWDEGFRTGLPSIDEQHQRLVSLINDLEISVQEGTGGLTIRYVLQELIRYVGEHFTDEENLMMHHNFPGLESHRLEHDYYVQRLNDIKTSYHDGDALSIHTLNFVKDWIACHIKGTDQIYARFILSEKGADDLPKDDWTKCR